MAQGSGTLKNLNLAYEREVSVMQKSIIKLREQEKRLSADFEQQKRDLRKLIEEKNIL